MTLKNGLGVVQDYWKWRHSIDHVGFILCRHKYTSCLHHLRDYYAPAPGGRGIKRSSASVVRLSVCPSVCLMSRTSALTRKAKGLGRRNFAQGYPRSHATPTPTSRSKGQKSRSRCGGILWQPPSRTACLKLKNIVILKSRYRGHLSCELMHDLELSFVRS